MNPKWFLLLVFVALFGSSAQAQEKGAVRPGFSVSALHGQKIVLFRPSVWVGEQSTAGLPEPNADWTEQARSFLVAELGRKQSDFANEMVAEPNSLGSDAILIAEYKSLFKAVAGSIMAYQFFPGNRLPTRKNKAFEWTLGEGTKRIAEITGANYGLFVTTEDQYGSFGRKLFQVFAAGIAGVGVNSGVHIGYAGLVDLRTGDLVWLNADGSMGGDVRTEEGMHKRVSQLLEDFPGLKDDAIPSANSK
jgi:hypothetical protein